MKKILMFLSVCCLTLIVTASVYCAPFLVCAPQNGVDSYKVEITGPVIISQDLTPDSTGQYGFVLDLNGLALPDGSYVVRANASNMWGTSNWSADYPFVKKGPDVPSNTRLVPVLNQ